MQRLIIVAALVVCGLAAPLENIKETFQTADLPRPSPINPDIPSDPKPEEKVFLIPDAEEQPLDHAEAVSQPEKLPGPYVPLGESLSRSRRAEKDSAESEEDSSEEDKKPSPPLRARPLVGPSATLLEKLAGKTSTTTAPEISADSSNSDGTNSEASTSSTTSAPRRPYSPLIHQHNEHRFRPTTDAPDSSDSSSSSTTAAPSVVASNDHKSDKRDIPVPLTRKYHHDDDATKQKEEPESADAPKEEVKQENNEDEDHKPEPAAHPATITRPIPVAELFAKKHPTTE